MKEVDRLRKEMEEDEEELGLAEDRREGEDQSTEEDIDEPPGSPTPAEVPSVVESPPPRVIFQDLPRSVARGFLDIDEDPTVEREEPEQPQSKGRKPKRKGNKPLPPEPPTKAEKKSKLPPVPDIALPAREDSPDVDVDMPTLTSGKVSDAPQTELSKREKRRLREAKKAREGQVSTSQVSVDIYDNLYLHSRSTDLPLRTVLADM